MMARIEREREEGKAPSPHLRQGSAMATMSTVMVADDGKLKNVPTTNIPKCSSVFCCHNLMGMGIFS